MFKFTATLKDVSGSGWLALGAAAVAVPLLYAGCKLAGRQLERVTKKLKDRRKKAKEAEYRARGYAANEELQRRSNESSLLLYNESLRQQRILEAEAQHREAEEQRRREESLDRNRTAEQRRLAEQRERPRGNAEEQQLQAWLLSVRANGQRNPRTQVSMGPLVPMLAAAAA